MKDYKKFMSDIKDNSLEIIFNDTDDCEYDMFVVFGKPSDELEEIFEQLKKDISIECNIDFESDDMSAKDRFELIKERFESFNGLEVVQFNRRCIIHYI